MQAKYGVEIDEVLMHSDVVDFDVLEKVCPFKCEKCKNTKPLRTHHCSVCNQCILLMDHHCMWTNKCIGLQNYKAFLQLNLYGVLGAFYAALTLVLCEDDPDY